MMTCLFSLSCTLEVTARGYWFSRGGTKGSFGYYPHLRDSDGRPAYPDTQIHGDLKMAAGWLAELGNCSPEQVAQVFGSESRPGHPPGLPSRVYTTDLTPCSWNADRFEVKSRIQVEEQTRTVTRHFLVDLELARLNGLKLDARLHLGPFATKPECECAKVLLSNAVVMLSGFGAFRSRGFGRGKISLAWDDVQEHKPVEIPLPKEKTILTLQACSPVRNKPIDPGNAQVVVTELAITQAQLKGWLARTYQSLYGDLPTPAQMAGIKLSPFYPTPIAAKLTMPPAMTTLQNEEKIVTDVWGTELNRKEDAPAADTDNFFATKTKPLGPGWFVMADNKIWQQPIERRFRNRTGVDFATEKNGLFVQEFLPTGTLFSGTMAFSGNDVDFNRCVYGILTTMPATIKGAWLLPEIPQAVKPDVITIPQEPRLVVEPIPFVPELCNPKHCLTIGTQRRYNTTRRRPRRSLIAVLPGSIVAADVCGPEMAISWQGFGSSKAFDPFDPTKDEGLPSVIGLKLISRAQAGQLRAMLHDGISDEALTGILSHRLEKYRKRGDSKSKALYELLRIIYHALTEQGRPAMNILIRRLLEEMAQGWWKEKPVPSLEEEVAHADE